VRPALRAAVLMPTAAVPFLSLAALLAIVPGTAAGQAGQVQRPPTATVPAPTPAGLTLAAFQARYQRRLLARDTDGDGKVSRAEFVAGAERAGGDPAARFARMDRNRDAALDPAEIGTVAARRFARLDADRDGVLTPAERLPEAGRRGGAEPSD